jgi:beta-galactosidase
MKAGGLNAIDLYVHWALHNPEDGVYNFDGIANVKEFIELAEEEGFYIIFRPGPYICAEIDNGGLPYWLASKYLNITLRTSDSDYLFEIEKWYSKLLPLFKDHWYGNGGKIIMVQVENELGAYKTCDINYLEFLRDETLKYVSDNVVLFTSDWSQDKTLTCGIDGLFKTINFGLSSYEEVEGSFKKLREYQPKGPLVVTEFWDGWFTLWQGDQAKTNVTGLAETLDYVLEMGASVNLYVYYGGTNFGFYSGADGRGIGNFMPDITSYDYDAPLNEAGNPTEKFEAFKNVIKKHKDTTNVEPTKTEFMTLENVILKPVNSILSDEGRRILGSRPINSNYLLTFEELNQFSGLVLYETILPKFTRDPAYLEISDLRDRALVYVDGEFIGTLSRENVISKVPLSGYEGLKLSILVENQGRLNFGVTDDYKGIRGDVRIQSFHDNEITHENLSNWTITGYPFEKSVKFENLVRVSENYKINGVAVDGPIVFHAEFEINHEVLDTYWNTNDWGKGFIFLNDFNLGRYWSIGPQMTIYVPKETLKQGKNNIYLVEYQEVPASLLMNFSKEPKFVRDFEAI